MSPSASKTLPPSFPAEEEKGEIVLIEEATVVPTISISEEPYSGPDADAEFGGTEERKRLERKLVRKLDLRMSILIIIYILNYVSNLRPSGT